MDAYRYSMSETPNDTPYVPITIEVIPPNEMELLGIIRDDLSRACTQMMNSDDAHARVLISVVARGVFVAAFATNKKGEHRILDIPVTSVYEMWQLKNTQADPSTGGWISVEFTVENDGFVSKTKYNTDTEVFASSISPDRWYVAPEEVTETEYPVWSEEQYREELTFYPNHTGFSWIS